MPISKNKVKINRHGGISMKWEAQASAHVAEDVSVQGRAMYPRALCVPQADGVV